MELMYCGLVVFIYLKHVYTETSLAHDTMTRILQYTVQGNDSVTKCIRVGPFKEIKSMHNQGKPEN